MWALIWWVRPVSNSHSINFYKYPKKDLPSNFCKNLYDELNFPHPNYASEDPIKVKVDIYVDRIFEIEAHKNTFKAQVNLWLTWQDPRLKLILKKNKNQRKKLFFLALPQLLLIISKISKIEEGILIHS